LKVLIVDDHPIVVSGLVALLSDEEGVEVLSSGTAEQGRRLFADSKPDVTVIDINLPDVSGFDLTRQILALNARARVLIFTMNDDPMLAVQALDCGARGFVSKNDDPSLFRDAIAEVGKGNIWLPADIAQEVALLRAGLPDGGARLSERELDILRLLSRGKSMSEIASLIDVSYKTVASDCATIRAKLNARTPVEMVRIAVETKLI
jgi:DNA-binding NarL/FixJ family response regulator